MTNDLPAAPRPEAELLPDAEGAGTPKNRVERGSTASETASAPPDPTPTAALRIITDDLGNTDFPTPFTLLSYGEGVENTEVKDGFDNAVVIESFEKFASLVTKHVERISKDGPYITRPMPGGDGSRKDANAGPWRVIPLDIDDLEPGQEQAVGAMLRRAGFKSVIASTFSHRLSKPKLRVWLFGDREISAEEHPYVHAALATTFSEQASIKLDKCMAKASQPIFLPSHPPREAGDDDWAPPYSEVIREGKTLPIDRLIGTYAAAIEAERARKAARAAGVSGTGVRQPGGLIERFDEKMGEHGLLSVLLTDHGYKSASRDRFCAPQSRSGRAAVQLSEDGKSLISWHENDPLNSVNEVGVTRPRGAFDVFCVLKHGGEFKAAYPAAGAYGIERGWWTEDEIKKPPPPVAQPLSKQRLEAQRQQIAPRGKPALPAPYPGVLADTVAWMLDCSQVPQAGLALLSALVAFSAAIGNRFCYRDEMRLNLYGLGLAATGEGKDAPRHCAREIAKFANVPTLSSVGSGQGLEDALVENPMQFLTLDEVAHVLKAIDGTKAPSYLIEIHRKLLELFSASRGSIERRARAAQRPTERQQRVVIENPYLCLLAFSPPTSLADALTSGAVHSGLLGRVLMAQSAAGVEFVPEPSWPALPKSAESMCRTLKYTRSEDSVQGGGAPAATYRIEFNQSARQHFHGLATAFHREANAAPETGLTRHVIVRSAEQVKRVAGVLAVLEMSTMPGAVALVTDEILDWAERFVRHSNALMVEFAGESIHDHEVQKWATQALEQIHKVLRGEIAPRNQSQRQVIAGGDVPRALLMPPLTKRQLDAAAEELAASERAYLVRVQTKDEVSEREYQSTAFRLFPDDSRSAR